MEWVSDHLQQHRRFGRLINGNSIIVASVSGLALVLHGIWNGGGSVRKSKI